MLIKALYLSMVKRYKKHSRISDKKFREILRLFLLDIEATKVSEISNISRPAINRLFTYFRIVIADYCEENSIFEIGEIELDESYFGACKASQREMRSWCKRQDTSFWLVKTSW